MSYAEKPFATPEEALAHYGVKGMHWGVRKERDGGDRHGSLGSVTARKTANATAVLGAAAAGRILGSAVGSIVAGPGGAEIGGMVGQYVGGVKAGRAIGKSHEKKRAAALQAPDKSVPNRHAKYTDRMVKSDMGSFGVDGARRINDSMNSGLSRNKAVDKERTLQLRSSLIAGGTIVATRLATGPVGNVKVGNIGRTVGTKIGNRAAANRASSAARNATANRTGLPTAPSFAKSRHGVHKITSM